MPPTQATLTLALPTEADTLALGAALAPLLRARDTLALHGDLGAGKTTLVRGLIAALLGPDTEVPSPTYTLVQTYETPDGLSLHHLDLYRLKSPDEVIELGWEDLATGVRLVEWPARAGPYWPASALAITLTPSPTGPSPGSGRLARLCGAREAWQDRLHALALALTGQTPADGNGACTP